METFPVSILPSLSPSSLSLSISLSLSLSLSLLSLYLSLSPTGLFSLTIPLALFTSYHTSTSLCSFYNNEGELERHSLGGASVHIKGFWLHPQFLIEEEGMECLCPLSMYLINLLINTSPLLPPAFQYACCPSL